MSKILTGLLLIVSQVNGAYEENKLLNRLFGPYRVSYTGGDGCFIDEDEAKKLYAEDPNKVPIECLGYIEDSDARYNTMMIPKRNISEPLVVSFSARLKQIIELNERDQALTLALTFTYKWSDDFMAWNPEMHGGIKSIVVKADNVWTPDILLINSESDGFDPKYRSNIIISYDGSALWVPPTLQTSSCEVDPTYFPFDTQKCLVRFGSWAYGKNDIAVIHDYPLDGTPASGKGSQGEFTINKNTIESKEWKILSKVGTIHEFKYDCCPDPYQEIDFELVLKRRSYYPVMTLVVPCVITAILICLTFFLPPDAGEKVGLNITILLAMVVFMDQLSAQTPPMKNNVPVIGQFFVGSLIIISFSLISTIYCLRLHHMVGQHALPNWLRYICRIGPKILCLHTPPEIPSDLIPDPLTPTKENTKKFANKEMQLIYEELKFISDQMRDENKTGEYEDEWKYAAMVIDRICAFVFFTGLFVVFAVTVCVGAAQQ